MTTTDRRRNLKTENCRACGVPCGVGEGYLYRDTNGSGARQRFNRTGRWGWFVKCESCHGGNKSKVTVQMERDAAARVNEPTVRPWSVSQVKKWTVCRTTDNEDAAIQVTGPGFSEIVSYRDPVNSRFCAPTGYTLEQRIFAGKPFSERAAAYLSDQILPLLTSVQNEEHLNGEAAVVKLVAAGATVTPCRSGHGWRVSFNGGAYSLWGTVTGNTLAGLSSEGGPWIETTVETLLNLN